MDTRTSGEKLRLIRSLNGLLIVFLITSVFCNLLLTGALVYVSTTQERTLVPPTLTEPVTISARGVDKSYLAQMANYLVFLKLNVSPETVVRNYGQFLQYVDSSEYHDVEEQLAKEIKYVKKKQNI